MYRMPEHEIRTENGITIVMVRYPGKHIRIEFPADKVFSDTRMFLNGRELTDLPEENKVEKMYTDESVIFYTDYLNDAGVFDEIMRRWCE